MRTIRLRGHAWSALAVATLVASSALVPPAAAAHPSPRGTVVRDLFIQPPSYAPVVSGRPVTFKATAPASLAGTRVRLLRRVGHGAWTHVGRATIGDTGRYRISGTAAGVGTNFWKVTASKDGTRHRSPARRTDVYHWYKLTSANMEIGGDFYSAPVYIGSRRYASADLVRLDLAEGTSATGYWNLGNQCIKFSTSIGLSNESAEGSVADFALSLDGGPALLGSKDIGDATKELVYVSSHLRLGMTVTAASATIMYPAFASPKILCLANPF